MRNVTFFATVLLAVTVSAGAQNSRHPFTFDDAASLRSASAVAVSPDGKSILYQVRFGGNKGPTNSEWNLMPIGGGESHHLNLPQTFKPSGFTADGAALYGLTDVNKMQQLATCDWRRPTPRPPRRRLRFR